MDLTQVAVTAGGAGLIGFTLWFFFGKGPEQRAPGGAGRYTCPMHPEIREAAPGKCPICGMELVKAK